MAHDIQRAEDIGVLHADAAGAMTSEGMADKTAAGPLRDRTVMSVALWLPSLPDSPAEPNAIPAIGTRPRTVRNEFAVSQIHAQIPVGGERHQDEVSAEGLDPLEAL